MALSSGNKSALQLNLSSARTARKVFLLLAGTGVERPSLTVVRTRRQHRYKVSLPDFPGVIDPDPSGHPSQRCCRRAYLRGAFLARGSLTSPDRTYHLEISVTSREVSEQLVVLLDHLGISAGIAPKRQGYVVYLKDGEQIGEFLRLVEAHQAVLALENVRIVKDMRNQVNRLVNAETANVDKTVAASMHQTAAITYLADKIGIESFPYRLRTVARARLAMPYASLAELGASLEPKISKSAVNHRLRRLIAMAKEHGFHSPDIGN